MTEIIREYKIDAETMFEKVKDACKHAGLPVTKEDAVTRRLQISTGWSPFSWGETMDVIVTQQKEGSTVSIDSRPAVWFNLSASDRVKRNAEKLFGELEK